MSDLEKLLNDLVILNRDISKVINYTKYENYDDLSFLNIDDSDPEQLFLKDELRNIMEHLKEAKNNIEYLCMPVRKTGYLHKNQRDRYEMDFKEFTCGSSIEALINDDYHDHVFWAASRIEHNGSDYYLVGYPDIHLEGLKVRIR